MKFASINLSSEAQATSSGNQQSSKLDPRITTGQSCTIIVGGFPEHGSGAKCAKRCLAEIQKLCNCQPTRSYVKGAFRKLQWFKFDNMQVRDEVVQAFSKARVSINTMRTWCAADSPLPVRVARKFLFDLKK